MFKLFLINTKSGLSRKKYKNLFWLKRKPIKVFSSLSGNISNTLDKSSFVQKPYLRSNYIETNFEEDIDLKNQF